MLGFPYIFRGALDVRATCINEEMKLAAVYAIASLAKKRVPDVVNAAYGVESISFGPEYIIPKALDPRLLTTVAPAVAQAAIKSGVARKTIDNWTAYQTKLEALMGYDNKMLRNFTDMAKQNPKRVVFAEANHVNMLTAAVTAYQEGVCHPILLGNADYIRNLAKDLGLSLDGIEIVNLRSEAEAHRRRHYAKILSEKRHREGITPDEANEKMYDRNYFGMMMVECGDADAFITGTYTKYTETIQIAKDVIGIREGHTHFGAMHIITTPKGTFFLADTLINRHPNTETLIDIAKLANETLKFFAQEPKIAMLSYSNFGADKVGSPALVHEAVAAMQREYPDLAIDGEMQVHFALNKELRDRTFPFSRLAGKDVNTLIFPNLSSANSAYKLLLEMGIGNSIGPIQMGLNKPIHFTDIESSPRDIVNLTTVAVVDAIVQEKIEKK